MSFHRRAWRAVLLLTVQPVLAQDVQQVAIVEGQPLAANIPRLVESPTFVGAPRPDELVRRLQIML